MHAGERRPVLNTAHCQQDSPQRPRPQLERALGAGDEYGLVLAHLGWLGQPQQHPQTMWPAQLTPASCSSGGWESRGRVPAAHAWRGPSPSLQLAAPRCVPAWPLLGSCATLCVSSYKDTNPIGLGVHPHGLTQALGSPSAKYNHIGEGLQGPIWGPRTSSPQQTRNGPDPVTPGASEMQDAGEQPAMEESVHVSGRGQEQASGLPG